MRLNFICDRCNGPVWKDIESIKYFDFACIICGKRWFVAKVKYKKIEEALRKRAYAKTSRKGTLLSS